MKKLILMMAAFTATLSGVADTETVDGIEWHYVVEDGRAVIQNKDSFTAAIKNTTAGALVIPSSLGGMPVTSIGSHAFYNCSDLTSVVIPASVTSIGDSAFKGCSGLARNGFVIVRGVVFDYVGIGGYVTIPNSVTKIGSRAFYGCSWLTKVTIPAGVTSIGSRAFYKCSGLAKVVFEGQAPKTGGDAFSQVAPDCTVYVGRLSAGWGVAIPGTWKGLRIEYLETNETDPTDLWPLGELWPSGVAGAVSMSSSSVYDGYLYDGDGLVAGLITVKVGKPNQTTKLATVRATVVGLNGKKKGLSAEVKGKAAISADGPVEVVFKGGKECAVKLGAEGMSGRYGDYRIDGALNVFSAKDETSKAVASAALDKWQGVVNVAWLGTQGWNGLSVTIAARGKTKVRGILADGKILSASSQLIVGEEGCCIPVVSTKKGKVFAFNVWLQDEAGNLPASKVSVISAEAEARAIVPEVVGVADAVVGRPGNLKTGAKFHMDAVIGDAQYAQYLPDGVPVEGGEKWTLPKAGRVVQLTSNREVIESRLGENPSALKLTYRAKDGSFKGSFKTYTFAGYRLKSTVVKVTGVLVNGVGYGTATAKGVRAPVTIE